MSPSVPILCPSPRVLAGWALVSVLAAIPTRAGAARAPLSPLQTYLPAINDDGQVRAVDLSAGRGGHTGLLTLELEDDYDAVQVGIENQFTSAWGLARVVVAPSASYGGDPVTGAAPYDLDGGMLHEMVPVQWSQRGGAAPGTVVLPLSTLGAAPAGQRFLRLVSVTSAPVFGASQPGAGWFVADGLGCLPPGSTITHVGSNTLGLSAPVTGQGCGAGQSVYVSPQPFGAFATTIPAAPARGSLGFTFSDWVPLRSLPRSDGAARVGERIDGPGFQANTTLAAVGPAALTLSRPLGAALPAHSAVHLHTSQHVAFDGAAGATSLLLVDAAGVRAGQTVLGGAALRARTHVAAVLGGTVTLDQPLAAPLTAGSRVDFVNTIWSTRPAAAGDAVLRVASTGSRPLLHIRYFVEPTGKISIHEPKCVRDPAVDTPDCESPLGLPAVWSASGGQDANQMPIDGIDYVSRVGGAAGTASGRTRYPSFVVRYVGRHSGATLLVCGGYQSSGAAGSVSDEASIGRLGAAWASSLNPALPISVVNVASNQLDTASNIANCRTTMDSLKPTAAVIQNYSNHTFRDPKIYRALVRTLAEHAMSIGVQPIIYLAYVEASAELGEMLVAADVTKSTTVPIAAGIPRMLDGSPSLLLGPGIPPNTTATSTAGGWSLELSRPVTVAAGTLLRFGYRVASASGTDVTLTANSYFDTVRATVRAPGIPAGTKISVKRGSSRATLSQAATIAPGTLLRLAVEPSGSIADYSNAAEWYYSTSEPWAQMRLDGYATLGTDPRHAKLLCPGCTTNGSYANDYGNGRIAHALVPLLQQVTGQQLPARSP